MIHLRLALLVFGATVAGVGALAAIVATTGRALPYHFPRGTDACFGRVYGEAFLQAHPTHRVSELYLLRTFTPGQRNGDARPRAQQIAADRASKDNLPVTVVARFRDQPGAYDRGVTCESDGLAGATCMLDCEGAAFSAYPQGRGLVLDRSPTSFVSFTAASAGAQRGVRMRLATDGVDFRLEPMPIEKCLAAYDHAAPSD
ncbi:MAG TPA: hypothetical protein VKX28_32945 [Xanthobacteraceae bacterium]|nr:hypothetical protein [Xanthobacteraceae bacterium]